MATLLAVVPRTPAEATALAPFIDLQEQGLTLVEDSVGLDNLGNGSADLTVNIGGPVRFALLYWGGREFNCVKVAGVCQMPFPFKDQQIVFDGTPLTGTNIGNEQNGGANNIGYFADVTSLVSAAGTGSQTFSFADGNLASNLTFLNGASLVVAYTDPAETGMFRVLIWDGLDAAWFQGANALEKFTDPVTFNHGAAGSVRQAELSWIVGDAEASRPDQATTTNNPTINNQFDASDGPSWDSDAATVTIPAGVGTTTTQVVSPGPAAANGDSLYWIASFLRVPILPDPPPGGDEGCTPGYWKNHKASWQGYSPTAKANTVFNLAGFPTHGNRTLVQTLQGGGGSGVAGGATILLRAAMAALLNAGHSGVDYPRTTAEILADVNAALATNNRNTMLALATLLDNDNNGGCPLN
jgi:hypothetical protein